MKTTTQTSSTVLQSPTGEIGINFDDYFNRLLGAQNDLNKTEAAEGLVFDEISGWSDNDS